RSGREPAAPGRTSDVAYGTLRERAHKNATVADRARRSAHQEPPRPPQDHQRAEAAVERRGAGDARERAVDGSGDPTAASDPEHDGHRRPQGLPGDRPGASAERAEADPRLPDAL